MGYQAVAGYPPGGGPQGKQPAVGGGEPRRAARVGDPGQQAVAGSERGGGAVAGGTGMIMGVGGPAAGSPHAKLVHPGFADQNRTGPDQPGGGGGGIGRNIILQ